MVPVGPSLEMHETSHLMNVTLTFRGRDPLGASFPLLSFGQEVPSYDQLGSLTGPRWWCLNADSGGHFRDAMSVVNPAP